MRTGFAALAAVFALGLACYPSKAGIDASAGGVQHDLQLIVMEADNCIYCSIFRRDVLPAYRSSEQGKEMPVRFVDVNDVDTANLDLDTPVAIVPTFIVVRANKEIGRIPGYTGPENFFHAIKYLVASAP